MLRYIFVFCFLFIYFSSYSIERRREQFPTNESFIIAPAPYSLPGIGSGVLAVAYLGNVNKGYTDLFTALTFGDVEGRFAAVQDFHLVDKFWTFDFFYGDISKAAGAQYAERGMDSDGENFTLAESSNIFFRGVTTRFLFFERMLEFNSQYSIGGATFDRILDQDGNVIADDINQESTFGRNTYGARLDLTDDFQDPRVGFRADFVREFLNFDNPNSAEGFNSEQYIEDLNVTAYIPVGNISTWVINYFQSDAFVTREGETDLSVIEDELGIDCSTFTESEDIEECEETKQTQIDNTFAANKFGTATNLGGALRLRGYPQNRFRAAHHRFYATEFRWNLSEEYSPFDLLFIKDIRTGVQLAAFYETATSADERDELGENWRSNTGVGLRIVARSGLVFRFEVAQGDEGSQFVAFFNYPWEGF